MSSPDDVMITLKCGGRTFGCSRVKLVRLCKYFEAIYAGHFSDCDKTEHSFETDVMDPESLSFVVNYVNTGIMEVDMDLAKLVKIGKATAMLQAVEYEGKIWAAAALLISPNLCISQAKLLNFQSLGSLDLLGTCFKRVLWKLYDLVGSEDFYDLTADELYWLLRNPNVVDPSGGVLALDAIDWWVRHYCDKEKYKGPDIHLSYVNDAAEEHEMCDRKDGSFDNEPESSDKERTMADRLRSRFIFALIEGLEEKVASDAPLNYRSQTRLLDDMPEEAPQNLVPIGDNVYDNRPVYKTKNVVDNDNEAMRSPQISDKKLKKVTESTSSSPGQLSNGTRGYFNIAAAAAAAVPISKLLTLETDFSETDSSETDQDEFEHIVIPTVAAVPIFEVLTLDPDSSKTDEDEVEPAVIAAAAAAVVAASSPTAASPQLSLSPIPNICSDLPMEVNTSVSRAGILDSEDTGLAFDNECLGLLRLRPEAEYPAPVALDAKDLLVLRQWRRKDNAFKYLYESQNKEPYSPCVVGYEGPHPGHPLPNSLYQFNPVTRLLEFVEHIPMTVEGARVTSFGDQCLMIGGEKVIGNNRFVDHLHCYDFTMREWRSSELTGLQRRNFLHTVLSGRGCVVVGGYEKYRKHARGVMLVAVSPGHRIAPAPQPSPSMLVHLSQLPENINPQLGALTSADQHLLLFCQSKKFHSYCIYSSSWMTRDKELRGIPDTGFRDAFVYGVGIYLTAWHSCSVYWMLLDYALIRGETHTPGQMLPPAFHAVHYGSFTSAPSNVTRVHGKLYSFCDDPETNERIVEVMALRYNPFDPINVLPSANASEHSLINTQASVSSPVSPATTDCVPSRRLLEHSHALQHKYLLNRQLERMRKLVKMAEQDTPVKEKIVCAATRNSALNLARSNYSSWFVSADDMEKDENIKINERPMKLGCWWCSNLMEIGQERVGEGKDIEPVQSEVVWKIPNSNNIRFKRTHDVTGSSIGCFTIFDPIKKLPGA